MTGAHSAHIISRILLFMGLNGHRIKIVGSRPRSLIKNYKPEEGIEMSRYWVFSAYFLLSTNLWAAPGTLSIKNLPSSSVEEKFVCFDDASGQLGNCPAYDTIVEIPVNCNSQTIQDAIYDAIPHGWIQLNITGVCNEDVYLSRSRVVLKGADASAEIVGQTSEPTLGVFNGANNIHIRDMKISGAGNGVVAIRGGVVSITGSTIQPDSGYYGVIATYGSVISLSGGNAIAVSGTSSAVTALDNSTILIRNSTNTLTSSADAESYYATLDAHRGSTIRINDTQTITNTSGGYALSSTYNSAVRQDKGFVTITGLINSYNLSSIDLRDASVTGDAEVKMISTLRFRDEDKGTGSDDGNNAILNGTVYSYSGGVDFQSSFTMNGNVECTNGFASGSPTFSSGSFVGC